MASVNRVTLLGHLGRDPEIKQINGQSMANFSIATTDKYKNKAGEIVEDTEWHNIVIWGKLADIVGKWLSKGSAVYLEGKLKTNKWEKDGVTRYSTNVICDKMQMLGSNNGNNKTASQNDDNTPPLADDDIPF